MILEKTQLSLKKIKKLTQKETINHSDQRNSMPKIDIREYKPNSKLLLKNKPRPKNEKNILFRILLSYLVI